MLSLSTVYDLYSDMSFSLLSQQMASDCGTTATVVGNWLINARTRKWRPAVVKAFELKRPSHLLLEDSINLFEDKPLRDLTEYESFQVPQQRRRRFSRHLSTRIRTSE